MSKNFYIRKGKFFLNKLAQRVKFDIAVGLSKSANNPLIKLNWSGLKYPVYLRKNTSDIKTFQQVFHNKEYDLEINFEPKVIFDLGANVGLAAIYFKNRFPNATIVAVEPESANYEVMVKNTEKYSDIHCLKSGVWNKTTNLKIHDRGYGNWGFITEEVNYEDAETVKAISIDGLMEKYSIQHIDILKIDIESSEKELFDENFEKWLPKVKIIVIELHDFMKEGCSRSFFKALTNYKFTMKYLGENIIVEML
jgi:FkbM family methyltransferase